MATCLKNEWKIRLIKKNVFYIFVKQLHTRLLTFKKYLRRSFIYIQTLYEM